MSWGKMKLKPTCSFTMRTLTTIMIIVDVLRAMAISLALIAAFILIARAELHRLKTFILPNTLNNNVWVDYFKNREVAVFCIVIGLIFCGADVLMAVALDKILTKRLEKSFLIWLTCATSSFLMRNIFYALLWKHEKDLGLDRLDDFDPRVKIILKDVLYVALSYEVVKAVELYVGIVARTEFPTKTKTISGKQGKEVRMTGQQGGKYMIGFVATHPY